LTTAMEEFPFEEKFQTRIAALTMRDSSFARRTQGLVLPEYFESEAQSNLVSLSLEYFKKYKTVPSSTATWIEILKDAKDSKRLRDDTYVDMVREYKSLITSDMSDKEYVADKVGEFARHQAIAKATMEHVDLVDKGKFDEAQEIMEKAFRVGITTEAELIDYWNDVEHRSQYRKDIEAGIIKPNGITTGMKKLDNLLYHKGWGRQELSIIMGGAKKGKSMGLGEFALKASIYGYNVLYISLEVSIDIIASRLDANISDTEINQIQKHISAVEGSVKMKSSMPGMGNLFMRDFPSGTFSPGDLKRLLEREKADGNKFDLIVIDYLDIMAPDFPTGNEIGDSKQIWLGVRALAFEENAACLSATQTNREGFKSSVARAEHAADDFNKIRTADIVLSINRSDEETAAGEARLFFAASRNQGGEFSIHIKQDLSKGQFMNAIEKVV